MYNYSKTDFELDVRQTKFLKYFIKNYVENTFDFWFFTDEEPINNNIIDYANNFERTFETF